MADLRLAFGRQAAHAPAAAFRHDHRRVGLALLGVAVSGHVLEGVNISGHKLPGALLMAMFVLVCIAAPVAAWRMGFHRMEFRQAIVRFPVALALLLVLVG